MDPRIKHRVDASKLVIHHCCLENGAILAAPSFQNQRSTEVKNYVYVWPRDGAFLCMAARILGIRDIQEPFFAWCMNAEEWKETGLFYKKYTPDGRKARHSLQVDQNAMVLIALHDFYRDGEVSERFQKLMVHTADGLCKIWEKSHFSFPYQEVWEQRYCFPDLEENFSYSLAACYRGLLCAQELLPTMRWKNVAEEMKTVLLHSSGEHYFRSFGKMNDHRSDASLMGLIWPFEVVPVNDARLRKTVEKIEQELVHNGGVHRFEQDDYDGWMYQGEIQRKKRSGYWPLLNFWMSIVLRRLGRQKEAQIYFEKVLGDVEDFIPEQVFDNSYQHSVSPLGWSHAMFVFAAKELGLLE